MTNNPQVKFHEEGHILLGSGRELTRDVINTAVLEKFKKDAILGTVVRAARSLLNWTVKDLARESMVSATTIGRIEAGKVSSSLHYKAIVDAFNKAGVTATNEGVVYNNADIVRAILENNVNTALGIEVRK
jgi:predicted transcriptional regulator